MLSCSKNGGIVLLIWLFWGLCLQTLVMLDFYCLYILCDFIIYNYLYSMDKWHYSLAASKYKIFNSPSFWRHRDCWQGTKKWQVQSGNWISAPFYVFVMCEQTLKGKWASITWSHLQYFRSLFWMLQYILHIASFSS